ncbi:TPA: hypothetical protein ACG0NT_004753, partial [Enterobacter kobei]
QGRSHEILFIQQSHPDPAKRFTPELTLLCFLKTPGPLSQIQQLIADRYPKKTPALPGSDSASFRH